MLKKMGFLLSPFLQIFSTLEIAPRKKSTKPSASSFLSCNAFISSVALHVCTYQWVSSGPSALPLFNFLFISQVRLCMHAYTAFRTYYVGEILKFVFKFIFVLVCLSSSCHRWPRRLIKECYQRYKLTSPLLPKLNSRDKSFALRQASRQIVDTKFFWVELASALFSNKKWGHKCAHGLNE